MGDLPVALMHITHKLRISNRRALIAGFTTLAGTVRAGTQSNRPRRSREIAACAWRSDANRASQSPLAARPWEFEPTEPVKNADLPRFTNARAVCARFGGRRLIRQSSNASSNAV